MSDIRNLSIWKNEPIQNNNAGYLYLDISELNLSVRSYNCLKRAGCHTIEDILSFMDGEGQGLRKIRNLGSRSEREILDRVEEMRETYRRMMPEKPSKPRRLAKPRRAIWDTRVEDYRLSKSSLKRLKACGILTIGDLYKTNQISDPGWYAVRELFEKIPF